ncbi:MAG: pantoate--beta-alanine ligase [Candidatus Koribacter versatilis]|uniref:Pantothenate synthetase n=1 Tax=Candidatus Korobacter versatilis TaxID=658062 RepID=A0A932A793_9BACT|nr:pantoate--beta-alanine ligase [Candidatus Koribacter versatilis]
MKIIRTIEQMRAAAREVRRAGKRLGFVPTMGALHAGHMALVRAARSQADAVCVSIFVNPTQFGPKEDLSKYPRPFEKDCELLAAEKVDFLFYPDVAEMYPAGAITWVEVAGMSERLDGKSRPGHFRGVTTIVSKLFHAVEPDVAFFGQKDAAQAAIIRRMARDLDLDTRIVICPTVREPDGLALSSRNIFLSPQERKRAVVLSRALNRIQFHADKGERRAAELLRIGAGVMAEEPEIKLDYFEIVNNDTLEPVEDVSAGALVAVAAFVGTTRLIDNLVLFGGRQASGPETKA